MFVSDLQTKREAADMNIALIGFGKMGKAVEEVAVERGHNIVLRVSVDNESAMHHLDTYSIDVAIDFTGPDAAPKLVAACLAAQISVVSGSTGWNSQLEDVKALAARKQVGFIHSSNFSIGVNLFFEINRLVARLMAQHKQYAPSIAETHHVHKLDAPSGTAITICSEILAAYPSLDGWELNATGKDLLPVVAHRIDDVPGTHEVSYSSSIDTIELKHVAHSRTGFAFGAVLAAEFIQGKNGNYTMADVLGIGTE
jgi:4-hydroxy-tetrahydrodipicolinate reductase